MRLVFYEPAELETIVAAPLGCSAFDMRPDGAAEIARRARGTPRVAMRLLRRIRDFAAVEGLTSVDAAAADAALLRLEVDRRGLDGMDRRYLRCIAENYGGGPVGVETMAAALGDERDVIEEVIEPYLIQEGFVQRTPRGRVLTETAFRHLDLPMPASLPAQLDLLAPLPLGLEVEETPLTPNNRPKDAIKGRQKCSLTPSMLCRSPVRFLMTSRSSDCSLQSDAIVKLVMLILSARVVLVVGGHLRQGDPAPPVAAGGVELSRRPSGRAARSTISTSGSVSARPIR